ncbi:MAG: LPS-assembly protein LptD [Bacteroidales bacterium]|nr:LPS-assembly protein LptD [Bacteroidales bacterium]
MTRKFLQYIALTAVLGFVTALCADARRLPLKYRSRTGAGSSFSAVIRSSDSLVKLVKQDTLVRRAPRDSGGVVLPDSLASGPDSLGVSIPDSLLSMRDSLKHGLDSAARADSISAARADSLSMLDKSSLDFPAFTTAKDSIVTDFSNGNRLIYYYGGATVTYENMKLTADYIRFDMSTNTVYARGQKDTLTGEWTGLPEMTQGKESYKMDEVYYNFDTRKARITNMVTKEAEGILQGQKIKMMPDQSINMENGMYTVCDLEEPHYYLRLSMAKVVTKPSQKTVFGPAWPVVAGVPVPIGLPFGFVPEKPTRATGLLMPTFGEEQARGFYMRDAGMYFVIGDYLDLSLTGDYYTLGSWAVDLNSRYKVNYKFNGSLALTFSNDQTGEKGSTDFVQSRNFGFRWSHMQDSKAHPGTSFSASVNFSSPSNNRYNAHSVTEAQQNQVNSSISYSRNWNGKFNLSVNALHNQNSRDSSYSFTLPNITFSVTRFYPFKQKNRVGKEKAYEKISFGYSTSLQNRISFKLRDMQDFVMNADGTHQMLVDANGNVFRAKEMGDSLGIKALDRMTSGMTHTFQIGLPSFTLFNYINVTPSVNYGMNWMFSSGKQYLENEVDKDGNPVMVTDSEGNPVWAQKVVTDPGTAFNHFGMTHTYSGSMSMSTRVYGMFNFGKHRAVQAIRHVITPSISLSFSPEKGTSFNGWRTLEPYYDKNGSYHKETWYNIYSLNGNHNNAAPPGRGKSGTMSITIGNNLEAKVRDRADTTGTGSKKVKLLDQLNLNTSYNFLADSLRMQNIGITMSTNIDILKNKLNLSGNLNFDPYAIDEQGRKINKFNIVATGVPARLTNASLSASIGFNGKGAINGNDGTKSSGGSGSGSGSGGSSDANSYQRIYYHPITGEYIPGGYVYYMNPSAPWSVNFSYSLSYNKSYSYQAATKTLLENKRITQTLSMSGNLKLTPRMSIQVTSGFDIMAMQLTTTQISATYDLHCFNIAFSWVPMGQFKSYSFRIAANASALADLLRFKKSESYMDNMLR